VKRFAECAADRVIFLRMPIPDLTAKGILPEGIHACTLDEVRAAFAGRESRTKREKLWNGFVRYLDVIRQTGVVDTIYLDGGFTSDSKNPNDIDAVLEIPIPVPPVSSVLMRKEFNHDYVKGEFQLDIFLWWNGFPSPANDLRMFFQYVKPKEAVNRGLKAGEKKGILKIAL